MADNNKYFDWQNMNNKAQNILGDDFWGEINKVIPKRSPSIDVYRTPLEIVIVVESPGVYTPQSISVKLRGFKLLIQGEIPWTYPINKDDLIQAERFIGNFRREINLPHDVSPNQIVDAQFKNGLIEIHIPRVPEQEEKEIPIDFSE